MNTMPPIEVIDLLSSPPNVPPPRAKARAEFPSSPQHNFPRRAHQISKDEHGQEHVYSAHGKGDTRKEVKQTTRSTINGVEKQVPVRSSPRRRAAAAALERHERYTQLQNQMPSSRPEDEFSFQEMTSSPAVPSISGGADKEGQRTTTKATSIAALGEVPRFSETEDSDPFASSPGLPPLSHMAKAIPASSVKDDDFFNLTDELEPPAAKPVINSKRMLSSGGFIDLSDDHEDTTNRNTLTLDVEATAQARCANNAGLIEGDDEFVYLSDDFDSTVNLEDSYSLNIGGGSKRRIIPEPETDIALERVTSIEPIQPVSAKRKADDGLKRSASDVVPKLNTYGGIAGGLRRTKTSILEEDPILFTSSPDEVRLVRDRRKKHARNTERENSFDNVFGDLDSPPKKKAKQPLSSEESSGDELVDVRELAAAPKSSTYEEAQKELVAYKARRLIEQAKSSNTKAAAAKAAKAAAREAEKEKKRLEKEAKVKEKQAAADVAKVNTLKTDKKTSTPEMIVDLPSGLNSKLVNQIKAFLAPMTVQIDEWDCTASVKDVIRWRRKVEARYNEDLGHWEPIPKLIEPEKHVLCVMEAKEFVELSMSDEGEDLDAHVLRMKTKFAGHDVIYLIEGLVQWMRKNRNVKNRQFAEAVRSQMPEAESSSQAQGRKRKAKEQEYIDEDMIEDSLLRLQIMHGTLIHHTGSLVETAQWIVAFTQHISTIPYRKQRMALDTAFCMESGQVKTGENPEDTFVKMLQEVHRITPGIAYGIAAEYPSAAKLVQAFREEGPDTKDMLAGLKKSTNKDGGFSDRNIGMRISRRVWSIFMGKEEGSTDI